METRRRALRNEIKIQENEAETANTDCIRSNEHVWSAFVGGDPESEQGGTSNLQSHSNRHSSRQLNVRTHTTHTDPLDPLSNHQVPERPDASKHEVLTQPHQLPAVNSCLPPPFPRPLALLLLLLIRSILTTMGPVRLSDRLAYGLAPHLLRHLVPIQLLPLSIHDLGRDRLLVV